MCGIVGYVGPRQAVGFPAPGPAAAGIPRLRQRGRVPRSRRDGQFDHHQERPGASTTWPASLQSSPRPGHIGIGHTRWATHGPPTDDNAHPHLGGDCVLAVVHNGVIENFRPLKERLEGEGYVFRSATDTEVIAHLIASCLHCEQLRRESMRRQWLRPHRRTATCVRPTYAAAAIEAVQAALAPASAAPTAWRSCSAIIPT